MATAKQTIDPAGQLTIADLAAVLARALETGYDGVRSGRVRNLPDARAIRWYQTLGILDRPASFRGRTALYTQRHVLQLAAVKKLQAAGFPLADIQKGLAGKTNRELAGIAGLTLAAVDQFVAEAAAARSALADAQLAEAVGTDQPPAPAPKAFWKARPVVAVPPSPPALQSQPIGQSVAVIWSGRPLSPAEAEEFSNLAQPLLEFLSSRAVIASTEQASPATPQPARPPRGART
ncbi:MAG: hypothetical protein RLZZ440_1800 [Planctomycetota bacterium]